DQPTPQRADMAAGVFARRRLQPGAGGEESGRCDEQPWHHGAEFGIVERQQDERARKGTDDRDDAQHQRAAPERADVGSVGERRSDVAGNWVMEEVAFAAIGGTPTSDIAPKVMKVPPPATALTALDVKPAAKRRMASSRDIAPACMHSPAR